MIFTSLLLPLIVTILKDRKEYLQWKKEYEVK
jgi:hypothetical protein